MKNNYSTLSNTYNVKTVNQTYTDTVLPCTDKASCSNNGECVGGQCMCYNRFYGDNCELIDYSVPPCDENQGWFWNPSYENECLYRCTTDGEIASKPANNNDRAYKYVQPPYGSQSAGKCYRIFDPLDHQSRKDACYTDYNPLDGGVCVYWQGSPAIYKWKEQDWISDEVDQCHAWPTCNLYLKNNNNVVAVNNNPIDYFNPVYDKESDTLQIKWGGPNEKGIGSDGISGLDVSIEYPSIPTS